MTRKLGKSEAFFDSRTLASNRVLMGALKPPASYNFDSGKKIPLPMFANDRLGCCVISARAHSTERLEYQETQSILPISDDDVIQEYEKETGGVDSGLVLLHSLKKWRTKGWVAGGRKLHIKAFFRIDIHSIDAIKTAMANNIGVVMGLRLPESAEEQLDQGREWTVATGRKARPDSWGGHCVYAPAYTPDHLRCVTWGAYQDMTWDFVGEYADEVYGVLDAVDSLEVNWDSVFEFLRTAKRVS